MRAEDAMAVHADGLQLAAAAAAAPRIGLRPHQAMPWLLLPDGIPAQVLAEAALVKVPNTRAWFRGVVSQRGNLLPVFDLAEWAGIGRTPGEGAKPPVVVAIGIGADAFALLSQRSPGLVRVEHAGATAGERAGAHGPLGDYLGPAWRIASGDGDAGHAFPFDVRRWLGDIAQHVPGTG